MPASPGEHSRSQRSPGLTCRAVRHAQHRTQRCEGAQGLAAALLAHGEHLHPAAGRRAGHEQHVLAAAEVRRFLLAGHYSLRPERVQVVKLHHGPENFGCSSGESTRRPSGRRPALPRWAEPAPRRARRGGFGPQCVRASGQGPSDEIPRGLGVTPLLGERPRKSSVMAEQRPTLVEFSSVRRTRNGGS